MFTSFRHYRQFYNRRVSVVLAILIGLILGAAAFLLWQRDGDVPIRNQTKAAIDSYPVPLFSAADLAPHKSLYVVSLARSGAGSQIIDVTGKMFYETKRSCDTLITDHRFFLSYDYADSVPLRVTSDFSTAENITGDHFNFSSRRRRDGEIYEELRGSATLGGAKNSPFVATYALPEGVQFDLSSDTLFPAAHTAALIRAAMAGKKFFSSLVFDGSDAEGPVEITAVIGSPIKTIKDLAFSLPLDKSIDTNLLVFPAWPIRLAFFPIKENADMADYELSMLLHNNGVISDMTIDYADFSVRQRLTALQSLAPETCLPQGEAAPAKTPPDLPRR